MKRKSCKAIKAVVMAATVPASAFIVGVTAGTFPKVMPPPCTTATEVSRIDRLQPQPSR